MNEKLSDKTIVDIISLSASIRHWERMLAGKSSETPTTVYCPLCKLYFQKLCVGCPISEYTGKSCCEETPYDDAHASWVLSHTEGNENAGCRERRNAQWQADAQKEIEFLKKVLVYTAMKEVK